MPLDALTDITSESDATSPSSVYGISVQATNLKIKTNKDMKRILLPLASLVVVVSSCLQNSGTPAYKDASLPIEKRVKDLISRMTLEEKVGQMNQFVGIEHIRTNEAHLTAEDLKTNTAQAFYPGFPADTIVKWTKEGLIGSFLQIGRAHV